MSMLDKILGRRAVAFSPAQPPAPALPDVTILAAAMRAEPGAWFDVTSVTGGDREAMDAVLAALQAELGPHWGPVRLWTPKGRGGYCVTLTGEGAPYAEL